MDNCMTKTELSDLLHSLEIPADEGISREENNGKYPRIVYWPFYEKDELASGRGYINRVTYQISLFDRIPQGKKYKELRKLLRKKGLHPEFNHEYIEKDPLFEKTWHTYLSIDVEEEVEEKEE